MKRIIPTLIVFLSFYGNSSAQYIDTLPWCPPGATWVYMQPKLGATYLNKIVFDKDTLIDLHESKKHTIYRSYSLGGNPVSYTDYEKWYSFFLRNTNDSIYLYNSDNEWSFLYFFNPTVNNKWYIEVSESVCDELGNNDTLQVSEIRDTLINNITYNFFNTSSLFQNIELGPIIKNIGPINNYFPVPLVSNCENPIDDSFGLGDLKCYKDNLRTNTIGNNEECEKIISSNYLAKKQIFTLYPNPTNGIVYINQLIEYTKIEIFDLNGVKLKNEEKVDNYIDISAFNKGVYIFKCTVNKNVFHYKIIKL
jgi:hypothetical protein